MKQHAGGFIIATSDLDASIEFYCKAMQLVVTASDGTSAMLVPEDGGPTHPWLIALRYAGRNALHGGSNALGLRAVFFRVDTEDMDHLEVRLRDLGGFHERHVGEFYEMISAYDPGHTAIAFWAAQSEPPQGPSFVPPSVYYLD